MENLSGKLEHSLKRFCTGVVLASLCACCKALIHPDDFSKLSDIEFEKEISKYGYSLCPIYFGYRLCPKKLPSFGRSVKNDTTLNIKYNWSFLDLFATTFFDKTGSGKQDHIRYKDKDALKWWPDYYLTKNEIKPKEVEFGPENSKIMIFIPNRIDDYLYRIFGSNYMKIGKLHTKSGIMQTIVLSKNKFAK